MMLSFVEFYLIYYDGLSDSMLYSRKDFIVSNKLEAAIFKTSVLTTYHVVLEAFVTQMREDDNGEKFGAVGIVTPAFKATRLLFLLLIEFLYVTFHSIVSENTILHRKMLKMNVLPSTMRDLSNPPSWISQHEQVFN